MFQYELSLQTIITEANEYREPERMFQFEDVSVSVKKIPLKMKARYKKWANWGNKVTFLDNNLNNKYSLNSIRVGGEK